MTGPDDQVAGPRGPAIRFSVLMNVFNGEDLLREAVDSVLAQSFPDWELIIWDDRSTDRTSEICASYTDPRIRYILAPEHTGLDRNLPARHARGEWLAYLDHDDIWLPHKLAAQNALIEEDGTGQLGLVYGRTMSFDPRGRSFPFSRWYGSNPLPQGDIFVELLRRPTFIALSSLVVRRTAVDELGGLQSQLFCCADYHLCLGIACRYRAACVQELCCRYRVHPTSMVHVHRKRCLEEALHVIEGAAGPEQQRILLRQRRILETQIGFEDIRSGHQWRSGVWRILQKGSLPYLASRPFVRLGRAIRDRIADKIPAALPGTMIGYADTSRQVEASTTLAGPGAAAVSAMKPIITGTDAPLAGPRSPAIRFSVIVNVYNGEPFLREAIDSVLAQSFTDWEMIIWDDRSSDRSAEICAEYADPRTRYFLAPEHTGIGAARNCAARQARGEWLAFLDQDDIWLPGKLAAQSALIEEDQTGRLALVYGRTMRFDQRGRTSPFDRWHGPRPLPNGDIFAELLRKPSFIALSSAVFRRAAFNELGGIPSDIVYCPDYYLCVGIARRYRAACVQEPCCLYRVHPGSMIHLYRKEINEEALHIIENAIEPSRRRILRTRQRVHQTLIGIEEVRNRTPWRGVSRILRKGSLPYLALRPFLLLGRDIRNQANAKAIRHELRSLLRSMRR